MCAAIKLCSSPDVAKDLYGIITLSHYAFSLHWKISWFLWLALPASGDSPLLPKLAALTTCRAC